MEYNIRESTKQVKGRVKGCFHNICRSILVHDIFLLSETTFSFNIQVQFTRAHEADICSIQLFNSQLYLPKSSFWHRNIKPQMMKRCSKINCVTYNDLYRRGQINSTELNLYNGAKNVFDPHIQNLTNLRYVPVCRYCSQRWYHRCLRHHV